MSTTVMRNGATDTAASETVAGTATDAPPLQETLKEAYVKQRGTLGPAQAEVFEALLASVLRHRRAVRFGEIGAVTALGTIVEDADAAETQAVRDARSAALRALERRGEIVVIATVRGESALGRKLYLPRALADDAARWLPREPLTFLDYVAQTIDRLLAAKVVSGATVGAPIVSTAQVRDALRSDRTNGVSCAEARYGVRLAEPMTVELAVQKLAAGNAPHIRAVSNRRACWQAAMAAPVAAGTGAHRSSPRPFSDVPTSRRGAAVSERAADACDYACDTDRVIEAARRAFRAVPGGVTAADVHAECVVDSSLLPARGVPVARVLSDLAKTEIAGGRGKRVKRRVQHVRRLGAIGNRAYYWVADPIGRDVPFDEMQEHFARGQVHAHWVEGAYPEQVRAIEEAVAPPIAYGRASQLIVELDALVAALPPERAISLPASAVSKARPRGPASATRGTAGNLRDEIMATRARAAGWCRFRPPADADALPPVPSTGMTLTATQLRELLTPFSATAARMKSDGAVKANYWRLICRIANPDFTNRRAESSIQAHEWYFDSFDARCYLAAQWGGPIVRLMAMQAQRELGALRDARYVVIALNDRKPSVRQRIVACLAMLGDPMAIGLLARRTRLDVDPGVRELALLALGLLGAEEIQNACEAATMDDEPAVRRVAKRGLTLDVAGWWRM